MVISEMRWGISTNQAMEENRVIELCMNEIENCRNYRAPPSMLSESEYNDATRRAKEEQNKSILEALQISYHLNNNLKPSSYVLFAQNKINEKGIFRSLQCNSKPH